MVFRDTEFSLVMGSSVASWTVYGLQLIKVFQYDRFDQYPSVDGVAVIYSSACAWAIKSGVARKAIVVFKFIFYIVSID